jgi:hypothetical protein
LWWMQPGWKETRCASCGEKIWPDGDPDWGLCLECFDAQRDPGPSLTDVPSCDICGEAESVTCTNGYCVCSLECDHEALTREPKAEPEPEEGGKG